MKDCVAGKGGNAVVMANGTGKKAPARNSSQQMLIFTVSYLRGEMGQQLCMLVFSRCQHIMPLAFLSAAAAIFSLPGRWQLDTQ